MKQLLPLALALFTIGCATTQPTVQAPQQVSQPIAATAKPIKTHIMYYWVDPITQGVIYSYGIWGVLLERWLSVSIKSVWKACC